MDDLLDPLQSVDSHFQQKRDTGANTKKLLLEITYFQNEVCLLKLILSSVSKLLVRHKRWGQHSNIYILLSLLLFVCSDNKEEAISNDGQEERRSLLYSGSCQLRSTEHFVHIRHDSYRKLTNGLTYSYVHFYEKCSAGDATPPHFRWFS